MGRVKALYTEMEESNQLDYFLEEPPEPIKPKKKYKYAYSGEARSESENCFPTISSPGSVVRDFLGASASYDIIGNLCEIDLPNFGTVDAWEDEEF